MQNHLKLEIYNRIIGRLRERESFYLSSKVESTQYCNVIVFTGEESPRRRKSTTKEVRVFMQILKKNKLKEIVWLDLASCSIAQPF